MAIATVGSFTFVVVQDNPDQVKLLQRVLDKYFRHSVYHLVHTGAEMKAFLGLGIAVHSCCSPLVLLDTHHPGRDGLSILADMRQSAYKSIPVVGYSNQISRAFFQKPLQTDKLIDLLRRLPSLDHCWHSALAVPPTW